MAYFPQFDLVTIGTDGFTVPMPAEDINVENLTTSTSLGTLTSDSHGIISQGVLAGSAGDIIEFSYDTYPEIVRMRLGSSAEDAQNRNRVVAYVLEDLYPRIPAKTVEIYLQDRTAPDDEPRYYSTAPVNSNLKIPVSPTVSKTMRVFPLSVDASSNRPVTSFDTDNFEDVTITATGPQTLFDHHEDVTTVGTSEEVLYTDTIAGQTLFYTDDKITAEYTGTFAATADVKRVRLMFAGTEMFASGGVTESNTHWKLTVTIQRVSNTSVRYVEQSSTSIHWEPVYGVLTGLDLYDPNDLELTAEDSGGAGGTTARMAYGLFIPSSTTETDYVTFRGLVVTYLGEPVTYP